MANVLDTFYNTIPANLYTGFALKKDFMPNAPVNCISLVLDTTGYSTKYFGQKDTLNSPIVTMTVRSLTYETGYNVAEAIRNYFDMYYDSILLSVVVNSGVLPLGRNANGNSEFLVQFIVIIKE